MTVDTYADDTYVIGYYASEYIALKDSLREWRQLMYSKGQWRLDRYLPSRHMLILTDYRDNLNNHGSCR